MRRILLMLLVCLLPLTALAEEAVLKDTEDWWDRTVHLRVEGNLLYMTMDGLEPFQPVMVKEGFVEAVRTLEESGERYYLNPDRMSPELIELLDDSLTGGSKVREIDVQQDQIILLLQGPGRNETLRIAEWNGTGYDVLDNAAFPAECEMDTIHMDDGTLIWIPVQEDALGVFAERTEAGDWQISIRTDWPVWDYDWRWHAVIDFDMLEDGSNDGYYYGEYPVSRGFEEFNVASYPSTLEGALACLDRSGWAVVNNPNPRDCLPLHVEPDEGAESLGAFYNRTPVRVIGEEGAWSQVVIGEDGLTGWMMTEYLAFGEEMDEVTCAFPQEVGLQKNSRYPARTVPDKNAPGAWQYSFRDDSIIGVLGDEWYIVMESCEGYIGYMPQRWFMPRDE